MRLATRMRRSLALATVVSALGMGAITVAPALAGSHTSLPPDRVDRIGTTPPVSLVTLPPDRVDGLGAMRLPTEPTPLVILRTSARSEFDWTAAALGAATVAILAVGAAATRAGRSRRTITQAL
jgi:hypothetical protein